MIALLCEGTLKLLECPMISDSKHLLIHLMHCVGLGRCLSYFFFLFSKMNFFMHVMQPGLVVFM